MGPRVVAPQFEWGVARRQIHHRVRGLPRDGATRRLLPADLHRVSLVGGEASQDHAGWWLRPAKEAKFVGLLPHVHPL